MYCNVYGSLYGLLESRVQDLQYEDPEGKKPSVIFIINFRDFSEVGTPKFIKSGVEHELLYIHL